MGHKQVGLMCPVGINLFWMREDNGQLAEANCFLVEKPVAEI